MRQRIALCDTDLDYARRMAAYVRESKFRNDAEVAVFQQPETLAKASEREQPDVIVLDAKFSSWSASLPSGARIVWMAERGGETGPDGLPMMSKYEPASRLLHDWLRIRDQAQVAAEPSDRQADAAIVAVWSAGGGVGKTTIASMLAELWLASKWNVFLIGFDPGIYRLLNHSSVSFHDMGDWLYAIKSGRSVERFEAANGQGERLHLFLPDTPLRERIHIGSKEAGGIIEAASTLFDCHAVIVDSGTGWSACAGVSLGCADVIVWVDADDDESWRKSEMWLNEWPEWSPDGDWFAKTLFVSNKGLRASPIHGPHAPDRTVRLPYVPEWKQDKRYRDPLFAYPLRQLSEEVRALCRKRGR